MSATAEPAIDPQRLNALGAAILQAHDVPAQDARLVAHSLVVADLWGHPSHGLLRLPWYVERLKSGVMTPVTDIEIDGPGPVCRMDGRHGIGQVIAQRACATAVERARNHGVGVVGVRNSNHFGTAAYFTRAMAEAGCVGILTTNGSPAMPPWGGREKAVGANPWSIAVPAGRHGVAVMDIANTVVARGKIYAAAERGTPIPPDWALDNQGAATTDPAAALAGVILPMAGHKGYAISFMMDALSGVLTGSGCASQIAGPYVPDRRSRCGHLAIAIGIDALIDPTEFGERMERLIAELKAVPLAQGAAEIFFPGEIEERNLRAGTAEGVRLAPKTLTDLAELAHGAGVAFDL